MVFDCIESKFAEFPYQRSTTRRISRIANMHSCIQFGGRSVSEWHSGSYELCSIWSDTLPVRHVQRGSNCECEFIGLHIRAVEHNHGRLPRKLVKSPSQYGLLAL